MADESEFIDEETITKALGGLMDHLRRRAADSIIADPDGHEALSHAQQYWAFASLVDQFGTALIAFDDIEDADLVPINVN